MEHYCASCGTHTALNSFTALCARCTDLWYARYTAQRRQQLLRAPGPATVYYSTTGRMTWGL